MQSLFVLLKSVQISLYWCVFVCCVRTGKQSSFRCAQTFALWKQRNKKVACNEPNIPANQQQVEFCCWTQDKDKVQGTGGNLANVVNSITLNLKLPKRRRL